MTNPVVSAHPVTLDAPGRGADLQVKVSAPATGRDLPVVLLSHGFGSSLHGYGPLADFWAAHGFVVIQPTHLDSRTLGLAQDDPRRPRFWRHRVDDLTRALDHLDVLEAAVPGLGGRLDRDRVAVAGHSFGGQTAGILLGLRVLDPESEEAEDLSDPRVRAGVLFATAGQGGADLTPFATENFPWLRSPSFAHMTTPALVVAGDHDSRGGSRTARWSAARAPPAHRRRARAARAGSASSAAAARRCRRTSRPRACRPRGRTPRASRAAARAGRAGPARAGASRPPARAPCGCGSARARPRRRGGRGGRARRCPARAPAPPGSRTGRRPT
jgi:dienelactone hydrolase